jgi:chromosome segregation ATPase
VDTKIPEIEGNIDNLNSNKTGLDQNNYRVDKLETDLSSLTKEVLFLEENQLHVEINVTELRTDLNKTQQDLSAITSKADKNEANLVLLEFELSVVDSSIESTNERIDDFILDFIGTTFSITEIKLESTVRDVARAEENLSQTNLQVHTLKSNLSIVAEKSSSLEMITVIVHNDLQSLHGDIHSISGELGQTVTGLGQVQTDLKTTQVNFAFLDITLDGTRRELSLANSDIAKVTDWVADVETQVVDLNLGLVGTKSSLDELRKVFESFQVDSEFGYAGLKADLG